MDSFCFAKFLGPAASFESKRGSLQLKENRRSRASHQLHLCKMTILFSFKDIKQGKIKNLTYQLDILAL